MCVHVCVCACGPCVCICRPVARGVGQSPLFDASPPPLSYFIWLNVRPPSPNSPAVLLCVCMYALCVSAHVCVHVSVCVCALCVFMCVSVCVLCMCVHVCHE